MGVDCEQAPRTRYLRPPRCHGRAAGPGRWRLALGSGARGQVHGHVSPQGLSWATVGGRQPRA